LRDYLRVVRRRKWIIVQAALLVPLAAVLFSLQQEKRYQGTAEVWLNQQNLATQLNGGTDPNVYQQPDRVAQTQANLARVREVARRTLARVGVTNRTVEQFLAFSSVTPEQNANFLKFKVTDRNKALANRLAGAYAHQFAKYRSEQDVATVVAAIHAVDVQLRKLDARGEQGSPLYAKLVGTRTQLNNNRLLQSANAKPVDASAEAVQVQPKPVRNGILGFALGIVLGVGLAFLWEALDTRIRTADEIGNRLKLPLLGRLPEPPRRLRTTNRLAMLDAPNGTNAEAFRVLRTNLDFVNLEREAKTILVTSAVEAEGKSTTAANLAVALSRSGRQAVLVDLDLRRPFVDRFFDVGDAPGLTQVALGHASLTQALVPISVPRPEAALNGARNGRAAANGNGHSDVACLLEVLRSGPVPPDPGEFVATQALSEILAELRDRADVVVVDAPPLLHLGDSITLSAKVDALLLVARLNILRRPMLNELHRVLDACPAQKLGFVLTGANLEEGYGYGGYGYYRYSRYRGAEREEEEAFA
jgi:Mrp family chromosome partitioning ATPase